ncbi:MAG: hypothetical protein J6D34_10560 [Atopobiaceae bacterium]|nr:hypothetical protein [Atopobiaceae bacterium]
MAKGDRRNGVSPELDALAAELLGDALDIVAGGGELGVLLVAEDAAGNVGSYEFTDDGPEQCLQMARDRVKELGSSGDPAAGLASPVRYAICYEAAVADEAGAYQDALLLEFGERGYKSYSGYSLFSGRGTGDDFTWTDPAPAGELEPLL